MPKSVNRYPYRPYSPQIRWYSLRTRAFRSVVLRAIAETHGPIVEAHGPNESGYAALGRRKLPRPLIITDPDTSNPHVTRKASVYDWPFKNGSLGAIINDEMPSGARDQPFDTQVADKIFGSTEIDPNFKWTTAGLVQRDLDMQCLTERDSVLRDAAWQSPTIMRRVPAFQLLAVARRSLEPGGVLLRRTLQPAEVTAATALGFTPIPGSFLEEPDIIHRKFGTALQGEMAFRLTNLETPLGQIVMQQNVE